MKNNLAILIACLVGILIVGLIFGSKQKVLGANVGWQMQYGGSGTVSSVTIGLSNLSGTTTATGLSAASSTLVLASNTARNYARVQNTSTNGYVVSCLLGLTTTSTLPLGIAISPIASNTNSSLELTFNNPYSGGIYCYSQSTTTVSVTEN